MTQLLSPLDVSDVVDWEQGLIGRRAFFDDDVYQAELRGIFARAWQFVGHESELPRTGDFLTSSLGEDPVVVSRQADGSLAGFLNVCRHRGMKLCKLNSGCSTHFTCTYHGWTYDSAGKLVDVPFLENYSESFDPRDWAAVNVRVASYKGLVFATFDESAPSLVEYLGDMAWYLDALVDRRAGGTEVIGGVTRWLIDCNWKFGAENFAGDGHHALATHASALMAMLPEDADLTGLGFPDAIMFSAGKGHAMGTFTDDAKKLAMDEHLQRYFNEVLLPESEQRLGVERNILQNVGAYTVFPNFSFLTGIQTLRVWAPKGPGQMELRSWVLVDRDASEDVKRRHLELARRTFSPSGLYEQDDAENWTMCQETTRGYIARQQVANAQMGLGGLEERRPEYPGVTQAGYNEMPVRHFYRRWTEFLSDPTERVWSQ